jgi:hypothetical protein
VLRTMTATSKGTRKQKARKEFSADLIALAVARAETAVGRTFEDLSKLANGLAGVQATTRTPRAPEWSEEEDAFLKKNLGYMTDKEIGEELGRTENAVHLRWSRDLHLAAPSKHPNVLTALQASAMLGIDGHKVAHWVDCGLIKGRVMAGGRNIRLIDRVAFMVWVCSPKNWVYFDIQKVQDEKLARLLKMRQERWDDEWWSARQAADYHGVDTKDVLRYVKLGRIESFRLPVSLGGRDHNRKWSNHFYLKSVVVPLRFTFGKGNQELSKAQKFTPRADAWLLKARDELGMTFVHIGRTMKIGKEKVSPHGGGRSNPTISRRYRILKEQAAKATKKKGRK